MNQKNTFKLLKKFGFLLYLTLIILSVNSVPSQSFAVQKKIKKTKTQNESVRESSPTIQKIEVLGLKKIEKDAVLQKMTSKVGLKLDRDLIAKDIQALFRMNYFTQIEVEKESVANGVAFLFLSLLT